MDLRRLRLGGGVLAVSLAGVCLMLTGCGPGSRGGRGVTSSSAGRAATPASAFIEEATSSAGSSSDVAGMAGGTPPWPCTAWAHASVTAYQRAGEGARVFGTVTPGDPVAVVARNADGWLAFSPGTAQAANVGPFRLRWLPPDAPVRLDGSCSALPVRASPKPGVCFEMAMVATPVRAAPDRSAAVVITLPADGYVAVVGSNPSGWLRVDAGSGSSLAAGAGWISPQAVNVNGPCGTYLTHRSTP